MATTAFFDGHLDLAYLAELGRDMHAPLDDCRGRLQPAAVTLPSLRDGRVRACLGTIFTEAVADPAPPEGESGPFAYPADDALAAWRAGMRQLKLYHAWRDAGVIDLLPLRAPSASSGMPLRAPSASSGMPLRAPSASSGMPLRAPSASSDTPLRAPSASSGASLQPPSASSGTSSSPEPAPRRTSPDARPPPLLLGILMECADPIETPDQLAEWADAGVIAVGMAWWRGSRYAGGNGRGGGLTTQGRELASGMDRLGVVHDLSHLSQRATDDLLAHTDAVVIASHSNCRALLGGEHNKDWQRHLSDETIAEIGRRGGIVGLNLVRNFIRAGLNRDDPNDRPSIDEAALHVEHVCGVMGHRRGVGLGSDMDGGIKATDLPRGIDSPSDLPKLCDTLSARGWSDEDVHGFAWANWARFWGLE